MPDKPKRPSLKRTGWRPWCKPFLACLAQGNTITAAAAAAHIDRTQVFYYRRNHPDFELAVQAALEQSADGLEDIARARAFAGSDLLLIFLLKAARPERYRDNYSPMGTPPQPIRHEHKHITIDHTAAILEVLANARVLPPIRNAMSELPLRPEANGEQPAN
jgi:hypothetical protein